MTALCWYCQDCWTSPAAFNGHHCVVMLSDDDEEEPAKRLPLPNTDGNGQVIRGLEQKYWLETNIRLSPLQKDLLTHVGTLPVDEQGSVRDDCVVTRLNLQKLLGTQPPPEVAWLDDPIINFFVRGLMRLPRVEKHAFVVDSFFYAKLSGLTPTQPVVTHFYRDASIKNNNIFDWPILLVPINLFNQHWVLGIVDWRDKRILFWNSAVGDPPVNFYQHLKNYIENELTVFRTDKADLAWWDRPWSKETALSQQQTNMLDCGVFVLRTIWAIVKGQSYNAPDHILDKTRIANFRKFIAYQILTAPSQKK